MRELIGVYDADGGLRGEAAYLVGRLLGRRHCGLCDVTHSPVRRKPAWDALVRELEVPFRLVHLNELHPDERVVVEEHGAPGVLVRTEDGRLHLLLGRAAIESSGGEVDRFGALLRAALDQDAAGPAPAG